MSKNSAVVLFKQIETAGSLVIQGSKAVQTLREAIPFAMREAGYHITFEPESDPELVDYLTVAGTSGLEWAAGGAAVGALLGLLCQRPGTGAAIGLGLGTAVGVARGIHRVKQGWRIRAIHVAHRVPQVTIHAVR
jgi:hypothetical protein